jgi:hypothetical protein
MYDTCPWCRNAYKSIGQHWRHNHSHAPSATDRQESIITGLLLGCGAYVGQFESPSISVTTKESKTAQWLSEELESLLVSVDSGDDIYTVSTPANPSLNEHFRRWYSQQSDPEPPSTSILTPLIARVWLTFSGKVKDKTIYLKVSYKTKNIGWHRELLREEGFNPWCESPRTIVIPVEQASNFSDYLGEPLPGAHNKWP